MKLFEIDFTPTRAEANAEWAASEMDDELRKEFKEEMFSLHDLNEEGFMDSLHWFKELSSDEGYKYTEEVAQLLAPIYQKFETFLKDLKDGGKWANDLTDDDIAVNGKQELIKMLKVIWEGFNNQMEPKMMAQKMKEVLDYVVSSIVSFEDWKENTDAVDRYTDSQEYRKDPYKYYGVSRSDFM